MKSSKSAKILMAFAMLGYIFIWGPIIVLCLFSFNSSPFGVKWENFTFKWFMELFYTPAIIESVLRSLLIASATTLIATVIGTIAGYGLYKYKFFGIYVLVPAFRLPRFCDNQYKVYA